MDKTLYNTLLYDFYGELLSEKQKQIYEMYYLKDFSLMEISECVGISRQGVRDNVVRCEKALENYENKLSLVSVHLQKVRDIGALISNIDDLLLMCKTSEAADSAKLRDSYITLTKIREYLANSLA